MDFKNVFDEFNEQTKETQILSGFKHDHRMRYQQGLFSEKSIPLMKPIFGTVYKLISD
jgi:hypothetical protein